MDYKHIYYSIIEKAKNEDKDGKRSIGYFEKHHIQPKSLGGSNDEINLVKLTAREHFICHWLLVKIYQKGSIERNKMLYALWRIQKGNDSSHKEHYINARAYEKLRIEFAVAVGELTKQTQLGEKNSQYGKKWYTSIITGESHSYFEKPNDNWIEGRNWFDNKGKETYNIKTHLPYTIHEQNRVKKNCSAKIDNSIITYYDGYRKELKTVSKYVYDKGFNLAKERWDEYHLGNYNKLRDYAQELKITLNALHNLFARYIPIYTKHDEIKRKHFCSDKSLVGIYE